MDRRRTLLIALLCALVWGSGAAAPAGAAPAVRGVAVDILLHEDPARVLVDVDAAAALGSTTLRVAVDWSGFEPVRGQVALWYQDRLDALMLRARSRGLKVLLTPVFTPAWASSDGRQSSPPSDPGDYARHVAHLARRYAPDLAGIEIWNEPNLAGFWSTDAPAARYATLVKTAYPAIKAAAPGVPVVAGAVAGGESVFLGELYAAGMQGSYDVLSVHVYNDGRAPETLIDPRWAHATFLQGLRAVRDTITAHGETRPIWITEMGWNTSALRDALWLDGVDPDQQAEYLSRALALLEDPSAGIDFTSGVLVYRLRDTGTDPLDPQHHYGLQTLDGTPKPSFASVRDAFTAAVVPAPAPTPDPVVVEPAPTTPTEPVTSPTDPVTTEPAPSEPAPTPVRGRKPKLRITSATTSPRLTLAGTVTAVAPTPVRRVEVAIVPLDRKGRCRRADGSRTRVYSACRPGRYRKARGTRRWSFTRKGSLRRGRHLATVRTVDAAGRRSVARRVIRTR